MVLYPYNPGGRDKCIPEGWLAGQPSMTGSPGSGPGETLSQKDKKDGADVGLHMCTYMCTHMGPCINTYTQKLVSNKGS